MMYDNSYKPRLNEIDLRGTMISIIICDDDLVFVTKLKGEIDPLISSSGIPAKIHTFSCAEDIGSETLSSCDIAFLDIDFTSKQYNGMDIARSIRKNNRDAVIVFVTNYLEYAPEGYEVQAFRYILKNELSQKLQESIREVVAHIRTAKANIKIQVDGEIVDVALKDICYIEAMDHILIFHLLQQKHTGERQYTCYTTLSKMDSALAERGFLRVHKSYLVNMLHIKKMNCNYVSLDTGKELPVSSKNYSENKKKYLLWRGQN